MACFAVFQNIAAYTTTHAPSNFTLSRRVYTLLARRLNIRGTARLPIMSRYGSGSKSRHGGSLASEACIVLRSQ
ncbi:hypothetical protein IG631_20341 [Alternaria alternata]|nr:hypothetical protein IG631_20341 [Alternaria alternata]